jgi:hypothetical protein
MIINHTKTRIPKYYLLLGGIVFSDLVCGSEAWIPMLTLLAFAVVYTLGDRYGRRKEDQLLWVEEEPRRTVKLPFSNGPEDW